MRGIGLLAFAVGAFGAMPSGPLPDVSVAAGGRERTPDLSGRSSRGAEPGYLRLRSAGTRQRKRRKAARRGAR
jgi:hypothetical protein